MVYCWDSRARWRKRSCTFYGARLLGGRLNKAKKGELRFPLPVGFCHDEDGHIVLDPDEEVRDAVSLVFRLFTETGSAFAVVQNFVKRALTRLLLLSRLSGVPGYRYSSRTGLPSKNKNRWSR